MKKPTTLSGTIRLGKKTSNFYRPTAVIAFFSAQLLFIVLFVCPSAAEILRTPSSHATIQQAVDAAQAGDTVQVAEGVYVENVRLKQGIILEGGWNSDFTERNPAEHKTTIDGREKAGWTVLAADDATIDGFTIINATVLEINGEKIGAGIRCESTSPTIKNNTIINNAPAGIYCFESYAVIHDNIISDNLEAGVYFEKSNVSIYDNVIQGNIKSGIMSGGKVESKSEIVRNEISFNKMAGIEFKASDVSLRNNLIHNNGLAGIVFENFKAKIINNTIVANKRAGVLVLGDTTEVEIMNNIIANNGEPGIMSEGKGYSHNLLFSNNKTENCNPKLLWCVRRQYGGYEDETSYKQQRDIIADPLFADFDNYDFRLTAGSPAIDAGKRDDEYNDVNFPPSLGSARNDLGAYGGPQTKQAEPGENSPPRPQVKYESTVTVGNNCTLDASDSLDPDGDEVQYKWTLLAKPDGSNAKLSKKNKRKTRITPDVPGTYELEVTVVDRWKGKASTKAVFTAKNNRPPTATASEMFYDVFNGDLVTLDGSLSSDPDSDPISYNWTFAFKPSGSKAVISDPTAARPTFTLDADGCFLARLEVSDTKNEHSSQNVNVCTTFDSPDNIRRVPSQYPTIQSAVDAADEGDQIIVEKGLYVENIIVDKNVDLIGIDWPTIDGGSKEGDDNTLMIAYIGKNAGKVEGFIIQGSGRGDKGHGINIWDSSPTITNNHIAKNSHNGIGVHGSAALTEDTKIYNNLVYDNMNGIGNGRGSRAHIYDNQIFNNTGVGIGSRGLSSPIIENNEIYGNHVGIGAREVAAPYISGNHIHDNVNGISISPISLVRGFAGNDIEIFNNLIFSNHQAGISATAFNMSKIFIKSNTIAFNNLLYQSPERGGGLTLGFPLPGGFTAVVENNIITGNKVAEIVNYTGPEDFKEEGASVHTAHNNVWNEEEKIEFIGLLPSEGDLSAPPLFTSIEPYRNGDFFLQYGSSLNILPLESYRNGDFFLSQRSAGQEENSPCIDAGNTSAEELSLDDLTTATQKRIDRGIVDIGYHYPRNFKEHSQVSQNKNNLTAPPN